MLLLENVHMDAMFTDGGGGPTQGEVKTASSPAAFRSRMAQLAAALKQHLFQDPPDDEDEIVSPYVVPPII